MPPPPAAAAGPGRRSRLGTCDDEAGEDGVGAFARGRAGDLPPTGEAAKTGRLSALFGGPASRQHGASLIKIEEMAPALQDSLKVFDLDGDGYVDTFEIARAAAAYQRTRETNAWMARFLCVWATAILLILGAVIGGVWLLWGGVV